MYFLFHPADFVYDPILRWYQDNHDRKSKVTITKKDNKKQRDNKDTSLCADKAQT